MKKHAKPYDGPAADDYREYVQECREARKFGSYYRPTDRCHVVYAIKVQERNGFVWVNVGQTNDYHTRVSAKTAVYLKRGARVLGHRRIKSGLTRYEAIVLEDRLLKKGFSRTGLPVFGK